MQKENAQHTANAQMLKWLIIEMAIYTVFVFTYFLLVLHYLRGWIKEMFDDHKTLYAVAALGLMVVQAVLLEFVTSGLVRLIRGKAK